MSESAFKCFTFGDDGVLKPILFNGCDVTDSPNQDCVKTYHPNGYVDIFRAKEVVAGNIWGAKKVGFITERTVEIDTEEDFEYAEWLESAKRRPWDALKRP
jgi:CMP-N-acetylneuraminic acid synthetase